MSRERRPVGGLESEVLAALAAAGEPLTPAQVLDHLDADLAYTTVLTTLARLHGKGLLARQRAGRAYAYSVVSDTSTLTARRMRRLLDEDADRALVLARFVAELGPAEERLLADLLADQPAARPGEQS